jgi:PAS domain S-box-containing protein
MGKNVSLRSLAASRRNLSYILAATLPFISTIVTQRVHWLHAFPFSLYFISMGLVAAMGGWGPMFVGMVCIMLSRWYSLGESLDLASHTQLDRFRYGVLLCCSVIISFISQRRLNSEKKLAIALETLQDRSDALVDSLHTSKCASWTLDYAIAPNIHWYSGSYPIFGCPFEEVEALPSLVLLIHPDDQPRLPALDYHLHHAVEPVVFEYRCLWPSGELHWLEMRGTRIPGTKPRWRGVTLDITERRAAEAAIIRAEKLAAMGRLASTVAHEINNPLEAVTNLLYLALQDHNLSSETRSYIATADTELARLGNVTRLTLAYTPEFADASRVDIAQAIDDVLALFSHRAEIKSACIKRRYTHGIAVAIAHHELRQILTNLIANAADALTAVASPRLLIEVATVESIVILTLADNGEGIHESDLHRIFEPFFSTKEEVGTGLGLWVTRELIEKNAGHIQVVSGNLTDGMSTSFRIELPINR